MQGSRFCFYFLIGIVFRLCAALWRRFRGSGLGSGRLFRGGGDLHTFGALGVLTFYMPEWGTGGKVVYATVTYSLMMIVYSSVNVPYAALLGVMSADPHERTVLAAFRMACVER